jgi:hypothetical protein
MVLLIGDMANAILEMHILWFHVDLALELVLDLPFPELVIVLADDLRLHVLALLLLGEAAPVQLAIPPDVFLTLLQVREVH